MVNYRQYIGKAALKRMAAIAAILAVAAGGYLGFLQLSGNFHTVIAGEFYRSAQPNAAQLEKYVTDHGIRTVINLRGTNEGAPWYHEEIVTASALGVQHIDFRMSASRIVTDDAAERLIEIMKNAPKPILVHCKGGADRTGIASAIYSRAIAGMDEGSAEGQLSVYFGHIGIPYLSSAYAMDESWERLEPNFDRQG